jgi:membrane-associated protease RseP (regulator of RpoE activity)
LKTFINAIKNHFHRLNTAQVPFIKEKFKDEEDSIAESLSIEKISNKKSFPYLNIFLFLLTFFFTSLAGAHTGDTFIQLLVSGLPYSITIMTILLSHEFGHYFAARHFGVKSTLPYFIPFPSQFGTMGAIIKIKSPIPDKKALFYIGVMGPLPGFIISLIAVIIGIYFSEIKPLPAPKADFPLIIFGDSLLFKIIVKHIHGNIAQGYDIFLSPYAFAGWIGFLITAINLIPIGQLDGAHILYALLGKKQVYFGWMAVFGLAILSFFFYGWILWIIITFFFLMVAHPYIPDGPALTLRERVVGWSCMIIFILTFIPVPVEIIY